MELDCKKMETKFKTRENAKPSNPEINSGESQTIPDCSISMREIINRFQRGIPVTRSLRQPVYNENFDYPDNMEFDDVHSAKLEQKQNIKDLETKKREYEKAKEEQQKTKANDDFQKKSSEPSA